MVPRYAVFAGSAAVVLVGTRFALMAILARRLEPTEFGQFAYLMWLVDISLLACSLGTTGAITRYAAEFRADPWRLAAFIVRWRRWAIKVPLLSGLVAVASARLSEVTYDAGALTLVFAWAACHARWAMQTAALAGSQRFDVILRGNLLAGAVLVLGGVFLPMDSRDPSLLFALMVVSAGVGAFTGAGRIRRLGASPSAAVLDHSEWRSIRAYSLNIWLTALLWALVWSRGEIPIVRSHLGDEGVASYTAAMTLFGGGVQALMIAVAGVSTQLTRYLGGGRVREAIDTARTAMEVQLIVAGAAALALICFGHDLMKFSFGHRYEDSGALLIPLGVGLISMVFSLQNHMLQIVTNARFNRDTSIAGLLVLGFLAQTLIPSFGLAGAAVARASTMSLLAVVSAAAVVHRWGFSALALPSLLTTLAICAGTGLCAFVLGNVPLPFRAALFGIALAALVLSSRLGRARILGVRTDRSLKSADADVSNESRGAE